ncbi:autotransporter-associated beta strand repeat-containing protein [Luteolibacter pohnpeiensis]|uniref:Autotransporter-associated beta strand repeat-containing protein n=1 Tax=Luteolibacter pohnpeiensis TaxID=454153 RepID=A0A934VQV9_9BACT|nr:autotransporter-associated beta strand repeat-containing protein [Luteolibacter pohnpeiensis]MBK1882516.1 autotransporter-associated beta strand repeat-containing protein [Luteolibacter pohnpeiensis]
MKIKPSSLLRGRFFAPSVAATVLSTLLLSSAAQAREAAYKIYRWTPTAVNTTSSTAVQLSEFNFSYKGQPLNMNGNLPVGDAVNVTVTDGSERTTGEWPGNLVDDNTKTKWYSSTLAPLVFTFDEATPIDSYNFATANDYDSRTPTAWKLEGSNDGILFETLDSRSSYAALSKYAYFTWQNGFALTSPTTLPAIQSISATTPTTIASGGSVTLSYTITSSTALTSVVLNPGNISLGTDLSSAYTVKPTETTTYTLTATNASGWVSQNVEVRVTPTKTQQYRYVRFTPLAFRGVVPNSVQIGEFEFFMDGTQVPVASIENRGGRFSNSGPLVHLTDGDVYTKWLDFNRGGIIFDFGSSVQFNSYQMTTANDEQSRDPVEWLMEGSDDYNTWVIIDHLGQNAYYPYPYERTTEDGSITTTGKIPFPTLPTPLVWSGTTSNSEWNGTNTNFSGTTFADGDSVLFDDTAQSGDVNVTSVVTPGQLIFNNSTLDYTLGGTGVISGSADLTKSGTGTLTIDSPNYLDGVVTIEGGTLVTNVAGAFGRADYNRPLMLDNATLEVNAPVEEVDGVTTVVPVYNHKPLLMSNSTIDVASNVDFTHSGKFHWDQTITKTGAGTLKLYGYQDSSATTDNNKLVVEEGAVEFGDYHFNTFSIANSYYIDVMPGARITGTKANAFGGNYINGYSTIGQIRLDETAIMSIASTQYLTTGVLDVDGVTQGRLLLKGAYLSGAGQLVDNRNDSTYLDGSNASRSVISTEASSLSSKINCASLYAYRQHWIFDVVEGEAIEDLLVDSTIIGSYGIVKQGGGNMVLLQDSTYSGIKATYMSAYDTDSSNPSQKAFDYSYGTVVEDGRLTLINPMSTTTGSATGASAVLVEEAGILSGTGSALGDVTIDGTVDPGDLGYELPIANLILGNTTLNGSYKWEVNGASVDTVNGETGTDLLVVQGNLTLGSGAALQVAPTGSGFTSSSYVIATYTGTRTGTFASVTPGYEVVYNDTEKQIEVQATDGTGLTGYETFIAGTSLTGDDAAEDADPDGDGIVNLLEFIFASDPETSGTSEAPTAETNEAGDLVFSFRRASTAAYLNPEVEYSTTLDGDWTAASIAETTVETDGFASGVDKVTVTLPASLAIDGKLFARLKASN